jgi:hypothetical protein
MNRWAMHWIAVVVVASFASGGCASKAKTTRVSEGLSSGKADQATGTLEIDSKNLVGKAVKDLTEAELQAIQKDVEAAIVFCRERLTSMEEESRRGAKRAAWLSLAGLVSGAVIAPALTAANASANAAWIAAFSGFGGATNLASDTFRQSGLSGSFAAIDRNGIVVRLKDQLAVAIDANKTPSERRLAIQLAKAECILYEISVPGVAAEVK